jgi:hypothetical protein
MHLKPGNITEIICAFKSEKICTVKYIQLKPVLQLNVSILK